MLKRIYVEQHLLVVTSDAIPVFNQYLLYCCTEITCSFCRLNNNQITHLSYIYARTQISKILGGLTPLFAVRFYCLVCIFDPFLFLTLFVAPPSLASSSPSYFTSPSPHLPPPLPLNFSPLSLSSIFVNLPTQPTIRVLIPPHPLLHPTLYASLF